MGVLTLMAGDKFWDKERIAGSVPKNSKGEELIVKLVEKKGKQYADIRTFYVDTTGKLAPGKGATIPIDIADEVYGLLEKVIEWANEKEVS